ncbi:MAG: SPOR domain-containing protein [Ignavibacteria bacterium]
MKRIYIYPLVLVAFLLVSLMSSCTSSDDEDIYVLKDTVVLNVDTLIKEQRNVQKVNLTFVIQLAAFKEQNYADAFVVSAKEKLNSIPDVRKTGSIYLVTVGKFNEASSAQDYLNYVKSKGFSNAFVKSLD